MTPTPSNRSFRTEQVPADESAARDQCRLCSTPLSGDERFCESCGFDRTTAWSVEIFADREYFDRVAAPGIAFVEDRPAHLLEFTGDEITIGRRSASRGTDPDIDLAGALADPGVSHIHATIRRGATGQFAVVDRGSTNGTTINDADVPIVPDVPHDLSDGDRIHVGAWTTIRLTSRQSG